MSNPRVKAMFAPMEADMTDEVQAMAYVGSLGCRTTPETFEIDWKSVQHLDMYLKIRFVKCAVCHSSKCQELKATKAYNDVFRNNPDFCDAVCNA